MATKNTQYVHSDFPSKHPDLVVMSYMFNISKDRRTIAPWHLIDDNGIHLCMWVNEALIIIVLPVDPRTLNVSRSSSPERFLSMMNNL